jgi:hypothetical protein
VAFWAENALAQKPANLPGFLGKADWQIGRLADWQIGRLAGRLPAAAKPVQTVAKAPNVTGFAPLSAA